MSCAIAGRHAGGLGCCGRDVPAIRDHRHHVEVVVRVLRVHAAQPQQRPLIAVPDRDDRAQVVGCRVRSDRRPVPGRSAVSGDSFEQLVVLLSVRGADRAARRSQDERRSRSPPARRHRDRSPRGRCRRAALDTARSPQERGSVSARLHRRTTNTSSRCQPPVHEPRRRHVAGRAHQPGGRRSMPVPRHSPRTRS